MKVRLTSQYKSGTVEREIEDFVTSELDGDYYERGALEEARATADNAVKCIARLLDHLAETRVINSKEFQKILYGKGLTTQYFEFIYPKITAGREQQ